MAGKTNGKGKKDKEQRRQVLLDRHRCRHIET